MSNLISGNVGTAGILVTLSGAASNTTTSANDGTYSFTGLSNGNYVVTPTLLGAVFTPIQQFVSINSGDQTGVNFTFTAPPSVIGTPTKLSVLGGRFPATQLTMTVTANQALRDLIVVAINSATSTGSSPAATVTDTIGNTYSHVNAVSDPSGGKVQVFYCLGSIGANANNVITYNAGTATSNMQMYVWYCSVAVGATITFDSSATLSASNQSSPATSGTFNTAGFDEIIFSISESTVNPGPTTFTAGTNQTFDASLSTFTDFGVNSATTQIGLQHSRLFASTTGQTVKINFNNSTQTGFAMSVAAFYGALTSFTIAGRTVAGATISYTGAAIGSVVADTSGAYSIAGLASGTYILTPTKAGYSFIPTGATITLTTQNVTQNFFGVARSNTTSTYTLQNEIDKVIIMPDLETIFNIGGYTTEPSITCATDVMNAICAVNFPHKWNQTELPLFYTFSWQQDYALVNADLTSVYNVEYLENGTATDINNSAIPKPMVQVEADRQLEQQSGSYYNTSSFMNNPGFLVASALNKDLYYGTWGQANVASSTLGNNPVANSVYTNPVGNYSMPANPINQIQDANGNLLVVTTYGHEGSAAPLAAVNASPGTQVSGTGATTVWTVVDPVGLGIRILAVPSQTGVVWQFRLTAQMPPPIFTSLQQTLYPLPDKYEPVFRQGFIAQLYRYSPIERVQRKFEREWALWLKSLDSLRSRQDRELEEYQFTTDRGVMGGGVTANRFQGAAWPFNYPRR